MIRGTHNESIKTVSRSIRGSTFETVFGSPDGIVPPATAELTEVQFLALNPANTYSVVPSNEHNNP